MQILQYFSIYVHNFELVIGAKLIIIFQLSAHLVLKNDSATQIFEPILALLFESDDFMIVLTRDELSRCQIGILNIKRGQNIKYLPFAFTELDPLATYNRKKRTKTKFYFAKMGSGQKSLRLQVLQCFPIQSSSNWFIACSTIS